MKLLSTVSSGVLAPALPGRPTPAGVGSGAEELFCPVGRLLGEVLASGRGKRVPLPLSFAVLTSADGGPLAHRPPPPPSPPCL